MSILIDTCTFSKVFRPENKEHTRFAPVYDLVLKKKVKIVIGGKKYLQEISKLRFALTLLTEFEKKNQLIRLNNKVVDDVACMVKQKEKAKRFNDEHLVAIIIVSGCRVICTDDKEAIPYLKREDLYLGKLKPPAIYSHQSHKKLVMKTT